MWTHPRRYVETRERRHKTKEVRRHKKEICERRHGQTHKRGHQRRTVKRCSFGENGGGSRGDVEKDSVRDTAGDTLLEEAAPCCENKCF